MDKLTKTETWIWVVVVTAAVILALFLVRPDWMRPPVEAPKIETPNAGKNPRLMP